MARTLPIITALIFWLTPTLFLPAQESDDLNDDKQSDKVAAAKQPEDEKIEWLQKSIEANEIDLRPIQAEHSKSTAKIYEKSNNARQLISMIEKKSTPEGLESIRAEIRSLTSRLDLLHKAEEIISDMDESARPEAIKEAKQAIDEVQDEIGTISKEYGARIAKVMGDYNHLNNGFAAAFNPLFSASRTSDGVEYKLDRVSANFSNCHISAYYKSANREETVSVTFTYVGIPKYRVRTVGKLNGQFDIVSKSNQSIQCRVKEKFTVSVRNSKPSTVADLEKALPELIDLDELVKVIDQVNFPKVRTND